MIFSNFEFDNNEPIYIQIKNYIIDLISKGLLPDNSKLPSSRELSTLLGVSRNSVVLAYEDLKSEEFIYSLSGKGTFVKNSNIINNNIWNFKWDEVKNDYIKTCSQLDISKSKSIKNKKVIYFDSISPNGALFDLDELKKSFLNILSLEKDNILNYGYAQGYKPLIDYLLNYMSTKGIDTLNKDILITNGFTEGLDILLSSINTSNTYILCENPTHNTSIKIMKSLGFNIIGFNINKNGIDFDDLKEKLNKFHGKIKISYITPSYHNPTGIVLSHDDRYKFYNLMKKYNIGIIEDGFNEELLYSSSHIFPIASLDNKNNGCIYLGSFSKILYPGMRIGWILADKHLVSNLISVKRCKNIHTSFLDQGILYDYLVNGSFEKYIKKVRKYYKDKFNFTYDCIKKYVPHESITGDGGLYIHIQLSKSIDTRYLLSLCLQNNVSFMPTDIFYIDNEFKNGIRIGFSKLTNNDIEYGLKIIGDCIKSLS